VPPSLLSAQPRAQHLVAQRLGGAGRAPLVLHALHAGQAGVGLLHHRDLARLRVVVGLTPVGEVDGVLGAVGEGTVSSDHPGPCSGRLAPAFFSPAHPTTTPVGSCPPLAPGAPASAPPRLQPPDPRRGATAGQRHRQQPTPAPRPSAPHSRLAAAHADGVQAGAEQAVGAQPRLPEGELLPLVLAGSCQKNGDEHAWAGAGARGRQLGTPLPSKRGHGTRRDLPPAPWYRR